MPNYLYRCEAGCTHHTEVTRRITEPEVVPQCDSCQGPTARDYAAEGKRRVVAIKGGGQGGARTVHT